MAEITGYKCPCCGSVLKYVPTEDEKLTCQSCSNTFEISLLEELAGFDGKDNQTFEWGDYKKDYESNQEHLENIVTYICKSCGAEIEADQTTAATHCPYCDSEVVIGDRVTGGIKPNGIIPFKFGPDGLLERVKEFTKGKKLLPKNFFSTYKISQVQGVYVPFWLFDADMDGKVVLEGTRTRFFSDSKYNYTETSYYLSFNDGQIGFSKIPVDGSKKMDNDLMDSVEPFDFSELKEFDPAYLSGYLADRFDEDPDVSLPRASARMIESTVEQFRRSVARQYATVTLKHHDLHAQNANVKYVLLPMYLLNLEYDGKKYRFAVNGQTGKMVGELPICKKKKNLYFWLTTLIVTAIAALIAFLLLR